MNSKNDIWAGFVEGLGYENEKAMFEDLYLSRGMGMQSLADFLGVAHHTLKRRLKLVEIPIRRPGGPNRLGKGKVQQLSEAELADYRTTAKEKNLHVSSIFKERRRRRELRDQSRRDSEPRGRVLSLRRDQLTAGGEDLRVDVGRVEGTHDPEGGEPPAA